MKYIRTKDGRIWALNEFRYEKKYHWYRPNKKYLSRTGIGFSFWIWCFDDEYDLIPDVMGKITIEIIKREECKFADTIEELCDEFVQETNCFGDKPIVIKSNTFSTIVGIAKEYTVYGAIWTNKGLIYVAKMNEKGELELL